MDFLIRFMDFLEEGMELQQQPQFRKVSAATDLTVTQCGFVTTDDTWHQKPLYATDSRLYFVLDGSGMLVSDREEMPLEPGFIYLAPCGSKCGFYGTDSVTKLYFHVRLLSEDGKSDLLSRLTRFLRYPIQPEEIKRLRELYLSIDPIDHIVLKSEIFHVVVRFLDMERKSLSDHIKHTPAVASAINYINANLSAKLTAKEVAESVFLSQSKLSSLFREEIGQSVARYIDDLLMSEARTLLCYTDHSIAKISDRLGYCDQFYFSRAFHRHFDTSPTLYRKSKNNASHS